MVNAAYNRIFLFLAFVGGLWVGDAVGDHDGNASILSILICGIIAIGIGFIVDYLRLRFRKKKRQ